MIVHKIKTHLQTVDGSIYCGINNAFNYPTTFLKRSDDLSKVTCRRCLKRYNRVGITKKYEGRVGNE